MNKIQKRYSLVPQMLFYDQLNVEYAPYTMFFNEKNFKSRYVNTDSNGFRYNYYNNSTTNIEEIKNIEDISIVIGGSTVFGFGATGDDNTISSYMTKKSNHLFLNFGATAFNSKQELILFINNFNKFNKIKNIFIVSGINDLYLNYNDFEDKDNFFFKKNYKLAHDLYKIRNNYKKKFLYFFYKIFHDKFVNPSSLKFKDVYKKKKINNYNIINFDLMDLNYNKTFGVWSSLAEKYKFNVFYFLQPLAGWLKKKPNNIEKNLFDLLDNSDDYSHNVLKHISLLENYEKFSSLLNINASKHKINFFDLNLELDKMCKDEDNIFVDRVHLTDYGHEIISNIILKKI